MSRRTTKRADFSRVGRLTATVFRSGSGGSRRQASPMSQFSDPGRVARELRRRVVVTNQPNRRTFIMRLVRYTYPTYRSLSPALSGFTRSPWSGLENEIDRLFETALGDFAGTTDTRFAVDLYEDKENTYVRAELPGVNRTDINVEMVEDYLTITAARKTPAADGKAAESFSFSRSVSIPGAVQADRVAASYENGVLTVTLPKREEAKPKKITVAVK
jgi:HSP20 family protein